MTRLVLLLLGADYMRQRWRGLFIIGWVWLLAGIVIFIDALDGALYFPIEFFAYLFLIEGLATLVIATTGVGGQRARRREVDHAGAAGQRACGHAFTGCRPGGCDRTRTGGRNNGAAHGARQTKRTAACLP